MNKVKYIILGAGPSGLTVGNQLVKSGVDLSDIIVLEKETEAGGLCRSSYIDDAPIDVGGGHFLDIKNEQVLSFLYDFMPENEWKQFKRVSKIELADCIIDYPIEANLWQMPLDSQVDYLESIAMAGCLQGVEKPNSFGEWIMWKLGKKISEEYMLPYNRKIWSVDIDALGSYWLEKLPDVSFRDTLQSCLRREPFGKLPAHGVFLYPKEHGYGEVWSRMGKQLRQSLKTDYIIREIDLVKKQINGEFEGDVIISTIPWTEWRDVCCDMPDEISVTIGKLCHTSIDIDYHSESIDSDAHWIYLPNEAMAHHRVLLRKNFIQGAKGYWTETNSNRSTSRGKNRYENEFAYPVNTIEKPALVQRINQWAIANDVYGIGRWGKWEHMNSDVAVSEALNFVEKILNEVRN